ncbi:uncharacterized protein LOC131056738 [Cryptomeria japonica]|uniref:uncharacterized protein LOC131056738 n=1 Tax=Cryptomeria japonica TaxID=3369 RepID=UPI0027DA3F84|nr:uncharacterized protein LOC131056738 [Cryptomeria japonica]
MVMVHLRKDRFPKGSHSKLMTRRTGPCEILDKYGLNAYKIELPDDISISPIFNVSDITLYMIPTRVESPGQSIQKSEEWMKHLPPEELPKMECILDSQETKKTRHKTYFEHLVKWKGLLDSEATWMLEEDIKKQGGDLQKLVSKST